MVALALASDQHVGGLDVAVNETASMGRVERRGQLGEDRTARDGASRPSAAITDRRSVPST